MRNDETLPSVRQFKSSVGIATSLGAFWRRKDKRLFDIVKALTDANNFAATINHRSAGKDIVLRRMCCDWLSKHQFDDHPNNATILNLARIAHNRILAYHARIYRPHMTVLGTPGTRDQEKRSMEQRKEHARNMVLRKVVGGQPVVIGKALQAEYEEEQELQGKFPASIQLNFKRFQMRFPSSKMTLEYYGNTIYKPLVRDDPTGVLNANNFNIDQTVIYCDEQQRQAYRAVIRAVDGKMVYCAGERGLVDTSGMECGGGAGAPGLGWGIFVVDFALNFYVHGHSTGNFHHSSFLSGDPVLSAGAICISNGVIVGVTSKTGHYRSGPAELERALLLIQNGNRIDNIGIGSDRIRKIAVSNHAGAQWNWADQVVLNGGTLVNNQPGRTPPQKPIPQTMAARARDVLTEPPALPPRAAAAN